MGRAVLYSLFSNASLRFKLCFIEIYLQVGVIHDLEPFIREKLWENMIVSEYWHRRFLDFHTEIWDGRSFPQNEGFYSRIQATVGRVSGEKFLPIRTDHYSSWQREKQPAAHRETGQEGGRRGESLLDGPSHKTCLFIKMNEGRER